jgi:arsenate reductase-like glutaredoxin family protein
MDFYRATRGLIKRVKVYCDPDDPRTPDYISFFENLDVVLKTHDIKKRPLQKERILKLICHYDLGNFLNPDNKLYKKHKLDSNSISRDELAELIEQDNFLLRLPIIVIGRLLTVGFNEKRIHEMLLVTPRDVRAEEDVKRPTREEVKSGQEI